MEIDYIVRIFSKDYHYHPRTFFRKNRLLDYNEIFEYDKSTKCRIISNIHIVAHLDYEYEGDIWMCNIEFTHNGFKLSKEFSVYKGGRIQRKAFKLWHGEVVRIAKELIERCSIKKK